MQTPLTSYLVNVNQERKAVEIAILSWSNRCLDLNGDNVFNLSYEFTPPLEDVPNSVIIKYHFINETMHYTKRWCWAQSGAYFLHPLFIFQFISFLFGNPKPIYERVP